VTTPERVTISADEVAVTTQPAAASTPNAPDVNERPREVVVIPTEKPTPVGAPSTAATAPTPAPATAPTPAPATAATTAKAPAPAPAAAKAPAPAPAAAGDTDTASDVLHRLVPDGDPEPEPADDPGDLRARLARTAALKKPGSRERQDEHTALQDRSIEQ
jgi:hypothetical protein